MKDYKEIIILVGMPGSGKSTIGKKLSEKLNYSYFDSDQYIEDHEKMSIENIFRLYGENKFRNIEKNVVDKIIPELKKSVVATGGGLPIFNDNMSSLKKVGCVIYLKEDLKVLFSRVKDSDRPLTKDTDVMEKINSLYKERHLIYEQSDFIVNCSLKNEDEIVKEIMDFFLG